MKHPMGMYVISVTEMWERCSFYIFSSILLLFMYEVLHFSMPFSSFLFGIIIGSTYFFQLIAGYISDTYLGNRKAIILGGIFILIAQLIFTYDGSLYYMTANVAEHSSLLFTYPETVFLIGVAAISIGASFFKVSVTSFVGLFYHDNEELLDSAYTIFYMLINIGGFFAPLILNFVVGVHNPALYQYGFMVGAITIFIGLVMFIVVKNKYLVLPNGEAVGVVPINKTQRVAGKKSQEGFSDKLSDIEIDRFKVILMVLVIIIAFFIAHEQISISILVFSMNFVNNIVPFTNFAVSPEIYLTLNPLFIIILSPIFIKLLTMLADKNRDPSSISKLGIGLVLVGLSYVVLLVSLNFMDSSMHVSMIWMVLFNLVLVISELFIMPIALSLISKLSPPKYTSLMVGVLFAATAVAVVIAGYFGAAFPTAIGQTSMLFGFIPITSLASFMWVFIIFSFVLAVIWLLLKNRIKKLMHGIT